SQLAEHTLTILIPAIGCSREALSLAAVSASTATTSWAEATIASLHAKGHRNSGARRAVVELLGRQHCCLTAQEIFDQLRSEGRRVGIASVYRVLEQLSRDGFVQRIDIGAGVSRYEPIHSDREHHHQDRKSTRLNSSHLGISYAVF